MNNIYNFSNDINIYSIEYFYEFSYSKKITS